GVEEVVHGRWRKEAGEGRRGKAETKKPSAGLGFSWMQGRVRSYPAGGNSGRRAREVMPAAMRAEVRTTAVAAWRFIGRASSHGGDWGARPEGMGSVGAGRRDVRLDRDLYPQAVARVVWQARAVLQAAVDIVHV